MRSKPPALVAAIILCWCLLGALVTISVAWVGAVLGSRHTQFEFSSGIIGMGLTSDPGASVPGWGIWGQPLPSPDQPSLVWIHPPPTGAGWPATPDSAVRTHGRFWSRLVAGAAYTGFHADYTQVELSSGAPLRSMVLYRWDALNPNRTRDAGATLFVPAEWTKSWNPARAVPLLPIWSGFLLDTLLYAALAFALWQIPRTIRAIARRARNRCPRCGYSLAGLAAHTSCPECGQRSKAKSPRTT